MKLNTILNKAFPFIDALKHRLFFVIFMTVYLVFYLNVYMPFNLIDWYIFTGHNKILSLSILGLIGGVYYAITQLFLRKVIGCETFTVKSFSVWVAVELIVLTGILTVLYDNVTGINAHVLEYFSNLKYIFLTLVIPYTLVILILAMLQSKTKQFELIKQNKDIELKNDLVNFPDENGNIKVSIRMNDILFLRSIDNYVEIYYLNDRNVRSELIRNSLKRMELVLHGFPVDRCHRSYMVNKKKYRYG